MKFKSTIILLILFIVPLKSQDSNLEYSKLLKGEDWLEIRNAINDGVDVNTRDDLGNTALHWASERNNWMFFIWLSVHNANATLENKSGITPTMIAEEANHENILSFLKKEYKPMELYIQFTLGINGMFSKSYDSIIEELIKTSEYCEKEYNDDSPALAISFSYIGVAYYKQRNYKKAMFFYEKSYKYFKNKSNEFSEQYATILNHLAQTYVRLGKIELAVEMYTNCLKIRKKLYGEKSPDYTSTLGNLGVLYSKTGKYDKALDLLLLAKEIDDEILTIYDGNLGSSANNLAGLYENMGRYPEAERLYKEALEQGYKTSKPFAMKHSARLGNLGILYENMGDSERALKYIEQANDVEKKVLGEKNPERSVTLNNLAILHQKMGNYEKALRILLEVREVEKKNGAGLAYVETIGALGNLYYEMGQKDKSLDLQLEVKSILEANDIKNESYGSMLNNLGLLYNDMGEYDKAILFQKKSCQFLKEKYSIRHQTYIYSLLNLSYTLLTKGDYIAAKEHLEKVKDIVYNILEETHTNYGYYCNNIGVVYSKMGMEDKGLELVLKANRIFKENLGTKHRLYAYNLQNISQIYFLMKKYDLSEEYAKKSAKIHNDNLIKHTSFLSERGVLEYLNMNRNKGNMNYFQSLLLLDNSNEFVELNYDLQLNIQARAIQNNINAKLNILSTEDSLLLNTYNDYTTLRCQYSKAYLLSAKELKKRGINLSRIKKKINDLEAQLSLSSKPLRLQIESQKQEVRFSDLSNILKGYEASLDFGHFQYHNGKNPTDTILYIVYLTLPNAKQPIFINLANEKQIKKILDIQIGEEEAMSYVESPETAEELYNLIFAPIEKHLKGISTLHISGSGLLHKVAFHTLQKEGGYLMDNFEIHYQGTMRDFVATRKEKGSKVKKNNRTMALFGNPSFTTSLKEVEKYENIYTDSLWATRGSRDGFDPLPETKKEIETIGKYAKEKGWNINLKEGILANEANFKSLSGKKVTIIHLATHGYSLEQEKSIKDNELLMSNKERITKQENPLFRSGLALSGANTTWEANTFPTTEEDGLLTAYEISTMDLFDTDLVVLSACNTGLGDILSGEGVFGLQRAFKTAGVKNTIVSLWEVDDEATRLLMEYFYGNYFAGKSVHESLSLAQEEMRKTEDFNEPYFWAGFILIE